MKSVARHEIGGRGLKLAGVAVDFGILESPAMKLVGVD